MTPLSALSLTLPRLPPFTQSLLLEVNASVPRLALYCPLPPLCTGTLSGHTIIQTHIFYPTISLILSPSSPCCLVFPYSPFLYSPPSPSSRHIIPLYSFSTSSSPYTSPPLRSTFPYSSPPPPSSIFPTFSPSHIFPFPIYLPLLPPTLSPLPHFLPSLQPSLSLSSPSFLQPCLLLPLNTALAPSFAMKPSHPWGQ